MIKQRLVREKMDIDKIIKNVSASLDMEGLKPSSMALKVNRSYLEGKISSQEAISIIKQYYKVGLDEI